MTSDARRTMEEQSNTAACSSRIRTVRIIGLPRFRRDNPEVWIARVEALFAVSGVTGDDTKFQYLIAHADDVIVPHISDLILNPPARNRYDELKTRILAAFRESAETKLRRFLQGQSLEDQKPSRLLQRMRTHLAGDNCKEALIKSLFVEQMPTDIQGIMLASNENLQKLALLADGLMDLRELNLRIESSTRYGGATGAPNSAATSSLETAIHELIHKIDALSVDSQRQRKPRNKSRNNSGRNRQRSNSGAQRFRTVDGRSTTPPLQRRSKPSSANNVQRQQQQHANRSSSSIANTMSRISFLDMMPSSTPPWSPPQTDCHRLLSQLLGRREKEDYSPTHPVVHPPPPSSTPLPLSSPPQTRYPTPPLLNMAENYSPTHPVVHPPPPSSTPPPLSSPPLLYMAENSSTRPVVSFPWYFPSLTDVTASLVDPVICQSLDDTLASHSRASAQPRQRSESPRPTLTGGQLSECSICYERSIDSVLYMCGHMYMCYNCAIQQWRGKGGGRCPVCRAPIRDVIRIYQS